MSSVTSPRAQSFNLKGALALGFASVALVGVAIVGALIAGVTPASAASFVGAPDTQVAVFMVPLTILVLALLVEVVRFARSGRGLAEAPIKTIRRPWTPRRAR